MYIFCRLRDRAGRAGVFLVMSYASQADLVERFGEPMLIDLTDRADPPANAIDPDVVTSALASTDAAIDGYLYGRYVLPLTSTPPLLNDLAQVIAIYKLHRDTASDKITADYASALKTLALISSGTVRLNIGGIEPPSGGGSGVRTTDRQPSLTPGNMKGFI
jgi:phage gp36-like protein